MTGIPRWEGQEFTDETRALVVVRQQLIPGAGGHPMCPPCGEPILQRPDFHHRRRIRAAPDTGRPSNCIAIHNRFEGEQCHFRLIHDQTAIARANGWIILASAPQAAYRMPMLVNYRAAGLNLDLPWVILDDRGGWRQARPSDLSGDYETGDFDAGAGG